MSKAQQPAIEYKAAPFELINLDFEGRTLEGYAAFFGNVDRVKDIIHPGAFRKTLAERGNKVRFLWQHLKEEPPLGRILNMKEDDRGLFIQAIISDTARGRDVLALLRDEALDALSIGYDAIPGGTDYTKSREHGTIRNLRELRLWEVSLVNFPANPEAQVTALKDDPGPTEGKPAPDVTENSIRMRQRDPGDFEEGSFRTISIGDEGNGIQAVVGRLKGETTTTIQTYIFDKGKFSVEEAQAWVDEHKKDAVPDVDGKQMTEGTAAAGGATVPPENLCRCTKCDYEKAADSCDFACPECGGEMELAVEAVEPQGKDGAEPGEGKAVWDTAYINDLPDSAFLYIESGGEKDEDGKTKPRSLRHFPYKDASGKVDLPHLRNAIARIPQSNAPGLDDAKKKALQDKARAMLEKAQGKDDAGEPGEDKAGRVLAARNAERIVRAIVALIETLEDAGIDVPGYGEETEPDELDSGEEEKAEPQAGEQAGTGGGTEEPAAPPTSKGLDDLRLQVAQLDTELELLEV